MARSERGLPSEEQAAIPEIIWPETMWPMDPSILQGLPQALWPERAALERLQYPWELLTLLKKTLQERVKEQTIAESAKFQNRGLTVIEGPVWIDEGADIKAFSTIVGPAYIGKGALVGNSAVVRQSIMMEDSLVGLSGDVCRTVMGAKSGAFKWNAVMDSIIGNEVQLSGGVILTNERLDQQPIKVKIGEQYIDTKLTRLGAMIGNKATLGAKVLTVPGRKIGSAATIETGLTVYHDVPNRTTLKAQRR